MNTDAALQLANSILDGTPPHEISDDLLRGPSDDMFPPPTPLARIRAIESRLKEAINVEHARIETSLQYIDHQLHEGDSGEDLWTARNDLTQTRDRYFRALDMLLSTPRKVRRDKDDLPPLNFFGWECAAASSHRGKVQRWAEITLYRTIDHEWVCQRIGRTRVPGETTFYEATVVDTDYDVADYFGSGSLSQSIYTPMGIVSPP